MKCPWKNEGGCANKCLIKVGIFALSVLAIAVMIKIIALILCIFSCGMFLNTVIAIVATVIVLAVYYCKGCSKPTSDCCNPDEIKATQPEETQDK